MREAEAGFKPIDRVFARKLLKEASNEPCFTALCYLFACFRQGHHCLTVKEDSKLLTPSLERVLGIYEDKENVLETILQGLQTLSGEIMQEAFYKLNLKPIVRIGDHYYLQKIFSLETTIAHHLDRLLKKEFKIPFSSNEIENTLLPYTMYINSDQKHAITSALSQPIHLLTGGPGTGKTYTVCYVLKCYLDLCVQKGVSPHILIAAPTGKAAMALKEKLLKQLDLTKHQIEVGTLHSILKVKGKQEVHRLLPHDLIIVDECSMIDLHLWAQFFSSIENGTRVLLVGDHHQLPPVETGMLFEELIKILPASSLNTCMRTEHQGLLGLAHAIKEGIDLDHFLKDFPEEITYREYDNEEDFCGINEPGIKKYLESLEAAIRNVVDMKEHMKRFCILSPVLEGHWGVEHLNERLSMKKEHSVIPIMITKTDYQQELYNGDNGMMVHAQNEHYALFDHRRIEAPLLPSYQRAYAISVHKSQGSEYDHVILMLPEGSEFFGREIIYTAITRAKKSLTILSKKGVFKKSIGCHGKKNSAFSKNVHNRV